MRATHPGAAYDPTYGTYDWLYYRLIVTNTNGYVLATVLQLQLNMYSSTDSNAYAISTGGLAIGSSNISYPTSLYVASGNATFAGKVGIGMDASTYALDVMSTNGCRIQSTTASSGYVVLQGAITSSAVGSINFYDGYGGSNGAIGGALVNGSYINMNSVFGITSGYSINGNLLASGSCGIGTASFNGSAVFDVGGTSTSIKYSFLNGLRISGVDINTIYQNIATSNINITTSGTTSQYIGFNIGNGSLIGAVNSNGLQMSTSKGIGLGTAPPTTSGIAVACSTATAGLTINGSSAFISMNTDGIKFAYSSVAGLYALNSTINDCVMVNSNNRFLFNPSASPYASVIMSSAGNGTTSFVNTTTGTSNASITGNGVITCDSITANNGMTCGGSINVSGGTPSYFGPLAASTGAVAANYVTSAPSGFIYWGGGPGTAVQAYGANSTSYGIKCQYAAIAGGFVSVSDKRIKRDIKTIDNSIEIIEKLKPCNYNIIETAENKYGFIAQEVEEVVPNVVTITHEYIPNIFNYADYNDKIITFDNKNNLEIVEGDEVKINYKDCKVIKIIDTNSFLIDKELETNEENKVFIIGTKVKDFRNINYDMITSINTAAIKELYSIIKQQQQQIAFLLTKLS